MAICESATRFDNDSYYKMSVNEETESATIIGEMYGDPVEFTLGGSGGGSSDFSTANVTFICNGGDEYNFFIAGGYYIFNGEAIIPTSGVPIQVDYDVNVTVGIPLYKGESIRLPFLCFENTGENLPVCTGDIVLDTGDSFVISGDGTITIQGGGVGR